MIYEFPTSYKLKLFHFWHQHPQLSKNDSCEGLQRAVHVSTVSSFRVSSVLMSGWAATGWEWMWIKLSYCGSAATEQAVCEPVTTAGCQSQLLKLRVEPRRHYRQSVEHVRRSDHVSSLCLACFFQLQQLRRSDHHWPLTQQRRLYAFISRCLDYCNSLLYGMDDGLLKKLQAVQNATACVTTETRKYVHIRPVLHKLH